jgi:hypothetical protein
MAWNVYSMLIMFFKLYVFWTVHYDIYMYIYIYIYTYIYIYHNAKFKKHNVWKKIISIQEQPDIYIHTYIYIRQNVLVLIYLFCLLGILTSTRLFIWMHEKYHKTASTRLPEDEHSLFGTYRRKYSWIKTLIKKCAFDWLLLHNFIFHFALKCYAIHITVRCLWCNLYNKKKSCLSKIFVTIDGKSAYYSMDRNLLWCVRRRKARLLYSHPTVYLTSCKNLPL